MMHPEITAVNFIMKNHQDQTNHLKLVVFAVNQSQMPPRRSLAKSPGGSCRFPMPSLQASMVFNPQNMNIPKCTHVCRLVHVEINKMILNALATLKLLTVPFQQTNGSAQPGPNQVQLIR